MENAVFAIFRPPIFTKRRKRTNTILPTNFRHIMAFPLVKRITWYYLSLQPKLGTEKWQKSNFGRFEAAILDLHIMGDTASLIFMSRPSSTFGIQISKAFEVTVLMLWFFKPFQISVEFRKLTTFYAHCLSISLYQNLPILVFPKSVWMCKTTWSVPDL